MQDAAAGRWRVEGGVGLIPNPFWLLSVLSVAYFVNLIGWRILCHSEPLRIETSSVRDLSYTGPVEAGGPMASLRKGLT